MWYPTTDVPVISTSLLDSAASYKQIKGDILAAVEWFYGFTTQPRYGLVR